VLPALDRTHGIPVDEGVLARRANRRNARCQIGGLLQGSVGIACGDAQDIANENDLQ
jgi:hypothetical protein